jgi:hypothetical protein
MSWVAAPAAEKGLLRNANVAFQMSTCSHREHGKRAYHQPEAESIQATSRRISRERLSASALESESYKGFSVSQSRV